MSTPYDCQSCGACCLSPWEAEGYVRLHDLDVERLRGTGLSILLEEQPGWDEQPEELVRLSTQLDKQGRRACVALAGCAGRSCACSIYDQRPDPCRRFEVGSLLCRQARQRLGLPV